MSHKTESGIFRVFFSFGLSHLTQGTIAVHFDPESKRGQSVIVRDWLWMTRAPQIAELG